MIWESDKTGITFLGGRGIFNLIKGVTLYNTLGGEPGENDSETAQVAVDGMPRKSSILSVVKVVVR